VVIVGSLMVIYVAFGGMLATTWVQITKAVLLLVGLLTLSVLTLAEIGFDINELYARAASIHKLGSNVFQPGGLGLSTAQAISLSIALGLGIPGLPHILMRFFTVPNPVVARRSLVLSMVLIAVVHIMVFGILGPAGVAFVTDNPDFVTASGAPRGGTNMVALHLANYLGGGVVFGFIAAVAFATILAVVSGLTVASASALSHDLYANVFFKGRHNERTEKIVFRVACLAIGAVAILLAILFKGQNIIYLTGMLYSIAASACFPILLMSIYWDRLTTAGALAGGYTGLVVSVALILIGPSVWVGVLKHSALITNIDQPAMFSVPAAFVVMVVVSLLTRPAVAPALGTRRAGR
jgi:cation/acetate symporter